MKRDPNKPVIRNVDSGKFFKGRYKTHTMRMQEDEEKRIAENLQKTADRVEEERVKKIDPVTEELKS